MSGRHPEKAMMKRTNNYFVGVREGRLFRAAEDEAPPDASKAERIMSRPPAAIDWACFHFFDDRDPASTLVAFERAKRFGEAIVFRKATLQQSGPWQGLREVGEPSPRLAEAPN